MYESRRQILLLLFLMVHWKEFDECLINDTRIYTSIRHSCVADALQRLPTLFTNGSIFANDKLVHFRLNVVNLGVLRLLHVQLDVV